MRNVTIKINPDGINISESAKKIKDNTKELAIKWGSTPDKAEVEEKIHASLKGLTRREGMVLLSRIKSEIIAKTPHDSTLDAIL